MKNQTLLFLLMTICPFVQTAFRNLPANIPQGRIYAHLKAALSYLVEHPKYKVYGPNKLMGTAIRIVDVAMEKPVQSSIFAVPLPIMTYNSKF